MTNKLLTMIAKIANVIMVICLIVGLMLHIITLPITQTYKNWFKNK